jgi:hypothetical protein
MKTLLLGAASGALILGIGGRIAMRGIAVLSGGMPGFSSGGTMTVVLLGALSGLAGAIVLTGVRLLLPRRAALRGTIYWAFLILAGLRGLNPVDPQRLLLFMPLILLYGITLQVLSCRMARVSEPLSSIS